MNKILKTIFINSLVFFFIIFLVFGVAEIYLKFFGKNIQINSAGPFFIHSSLRQKDIFIDNQGYLDRDGFRTIEKTKTGSLIIDAYQWFKINRDQCSIIIIGDSSPFGDGRLPQDTWPSKFDEKNNCKVFTFAQNGWSSLQMFEFHETFLKQLDYDYLIISVVHNDAHLIGKYKEFNYEKDVLKYRYFMDAFHWRIQKNWQKLKNRSEVIYIIERFINQIFNKKKKKGSLANPPIETWGYSNYVKRMWEPDIQEIWRKSLITFYKDNSEKNILYFFAINLLSEDKDYLSLRNHFESNGIEYLYCRDERIKMGIRTRKDWANLADGHPGTRQIKIFSDCLANYFNNKF